MKLAEVGGWTARTDGRIQSVWLGESPPRNTATVNKIKVNYFSISIRSMMESDRH